MSLAPSPKIALDRTSCTIGKADDQPCNVTDDNLKADCYESMHAFKKIRTSTSGLRKSPNKWTKEENQKLTALVAHYGEKKWKRISAEMGGQKTGAQCAQHWKRVLSPEIRKGHWDENEEDLLLRLVVQYGSCWKKIAKKIPQRTDIQCRYQYLKAKQSREVRWDAKEDESLIKKVMELANCSSFKFINDNNYCATNSSPNNFYDPSNSNYTNSLANNTLPPSHNRSPNSINKENESDNRHFRLNSSSSSDIVDDRSSLKSSGESSSSEGSISAWNDKTTPDVDMGDASNSSSSSTDMRLPSIPGTEGSGSSGSGGSGSGGVGSVGSGNVGLELQKVVWLEIAEHMARMKLTSTLRTALECKTRFADLLRNITFSPSPDGSTKGFDLKGSGGIFNSASPGLSSTPSNTNNTNTNPTNSPARPANININISNSSDNNNNNITITNFSHNITININNSNTANNNSNNSNSSNNTMPIPGTNFQRNTPTPSRNFHPTFKTETPNDIPRASTIPSLPTAPSFPSFPHFPPVAQPLAPTTKQPRIPIQMAPISSVPSSLGGVGGLESLAAVASILPREMLADYAQF